MIPHAELPHVIVCGGRDFTDYQLLSTKLDLYTAKLGRCVICTGACPTGADKLAEQWAFARRHIVKRYHADWNEHGKAAGPIRNREMAEEIAKLLNGFCVAFWDGQSKGTRNCIEECQKVKIPTRMVKY